MTAPPPRPLRDRALDNLSYIRAAMERAHVRGYLRRHGIGTPDRIDKP